MLYNKNMLNYYFTETDDGSTGLYSKTAGDILHSKEGALKEAFEKFINPANKILKSNDNLRILDLCSGVGYNLKALLTKMKNKCAQIDCVDINWDFILLSPFIIDNINDINMKLFLLSGFSFIDNFVDRINTLISNLEELGFKKFLCPSMTDLIKFLFREGYKDSGRALNLSFLHNIYYKYISTSMKYSLNFNEYSNIEINYKLGDARTIIKNLHNPYDLVFHDGFAPQKDPTLWTFDFLSLLKNNLHYNSLITTYSKSSPFRSALCNLNFFVGKTFSNGLEIGTIASLNHDNIICPLSDRDLKLLETNSGICYRDPFLNLQSSEILRNRELEQKNSNRQSRTSFSKLYSH